MTARVPKPTLIDAIAEMLPAAIVDSVSTTDWHSATFSGIRSCIKIILPGENAAERANEFAAILPDYEFDLRRYIVADIIVTGITECSGQVTLTVEALLLDP